MFNMADIHHAKKKASVNHEKKSEDYDKVLKEAILIYQQFTDNPQEATIRKAADKFYEALTLKRNQMEPYLFLAMIFFLFEEEDKAKKYFAGAAELAGDKPEYAEFLGHVKRTLYEVSA